MYELDKFTAMSLNSLVNKTFLTIKKNNEIVKYDLLLNNVNTTQLVDDLNVTSNLVPLYLQILASIFYTTSMILAIGGNLLVLLIVFSYKHTINVNNFFIMNLAVSDLIFALLCIPSTFITAYLIQYWPFSNFLCIFFNYMQTVSVTLTVYTLILITIDKYSAVVRPLKLRMSISMCKFLILLSWLFSLFISAPIALFTKVSSTSSDNSTSNDLVQLPQCIESWPNDFLHLAQVYNVFLLLIQYFIPLLILTVCYARIGLVLRRNKAPGESIEKRDAKMSQSKKRVLKMCFVMVLTFMIFWAPLQFLNVYRFYDEQIAYSKYFGDIFFVCHLFAVSRSFINPFIYAWIHKHYRDGFTYFMSCACWSANEMKRSKFDNSTRYMTSVNFTSSKKSSSRQKESFERRKKSSQVSNFKNNNNNTQRQINRNGYSCKEFKIEFIE